MVVQERESLLRVVLLEEGNLLRVVQSELEKDVLLLMVRVEGFLLAFRARVYSTRDLEIKASLDYIVQLDREEFAVS